MRTQRRGVCPRAASPRPSSGSTPGRDRAFGTGIVDTESGAVAGLPVIVDDVHAAGRALMARGVDASDVQE
jgi:hypothetical protein